MPVIPDHQLIASLLAKPNAPHLLKEVEQQLDKEREKRLQFYNEITEQQKAEFINGEIIIHSPVIKAHNDASGLLLNLLSNYVRKNKLGFVGYEKIMIALTRNDYEPDICFFNNDKAQHFKKDQSLFPAPDFLVEVLSKSTTANDRGVKFNDYQAHGIMEYWLVHPTQNYVEQYVLNNQKQYELLLKAGEGNIKSKAIEGFKIPIAAMFDEAANMKALGEMMKH